VCIKPRFLFFPLHGFRIGAYASRALFSRPDLEPKMTGI
jgi:hypothetical protein